MATTQNMLTHPDHIESVLNEDALSTTPDPVPANLKDLSRLITKSLEMADAEHDHTSVFRDLNSVNIAVAMADSNLYEAARDHFRQTDPQDDHWSPEFAARNEDTCEVDSVLRGLLGDFMRAGMYLERLLHTGPPAE